MASNDSECDSYIHNVLKTGDHGPHRHIIVDNVALNDAIDKHQTQIGMSSRSDGLPVPAVLELYLQYPSSSLML